MEPLETKKLVLKAAKVKKSRKEVLPSHSNAKTMKMRQKGVPSKTDAMANKEADEVLDSNSSFYAKDNTAEEAYKISLNYPNMYAGDEANKEADEVLDNNSSFYAKDNTAEEAYKISLNYPNMDAGDEANKKADEVLDSNSSFYAKDNTAEEAYKISLNYPNMYAGDEANKEADEVLDSNSSFYAKDNTAEEAYKISLNYPNMYAGDEANKEADEVLDSNSSFYAKDNTAEEAYKISLNYPNMYAGDEVNKEADEVLDSNSSFYAKDNTADETYKISIKYRNTDAGDEITEKTYEIPVHPIDYPKWDSRVEATEAYDGIFKISRQPEGKQPRSTFTYAPSGYHTETLQILRRTLESSSTLAEAMYLVKDLEMKTKINFEPFLKFVEPPSSTITTAQQKGDRQLGGSFVPRSYLEIGAARLSGMGESTGLLCPLCGTETSYYFLRNHVKLMMCSNSECSYPFGNNKSLKPYSKKNSDIYLPHVNLCPNRKRASHTIVSAPETDEAASVEITSEAMSESKQKKETDKEDMEQKLKEFRKMLKEGDEVENPDAIITNVKWLKNLYRLKGPLLLKPSELKILHRAIATANACTRGGQNNTP